MHVTELDAIRIRDGRAGVGYSMDSRLAAAQSDRRALLAEVDRLRAAIKRAAGELRSRAAGSDRDADKSNDESAARWQRFLAVNERDAANLLLRAIDWEDSQ